MQNELLCFVHDLVTQKFTNDENNNAFFVTNSCQTQSKEPSQTRTIVLNKACVPKHNGTLFDLFKHYEQVFKLVRSVSANSNFR